MAKHNGLVLFFLLLASTHAIISSSVQNYSFMDETVVKQSINVKDTYTGLTISEVLKLISFPKINQSDLSETTVAIIDSGINNSMLNNQWINENEIKDNQIDDDNNGYTDDYFGWDYITDQPIKEATMSIGEKYSNHGSFISNIIVQTNPKAKIMNIRVLDSNNSNSNFEDFANAILYAISFPEVKTIQLSIEFTPIIFLGYPRLLHWAFTKAFLQNVTIVSVTGNNGESTISDPGNWSETIAVAAVEQNRKSPDFSWIKAYYSNAGPNIDVSAPGTHIISSGYDSRNIVMSGTSFSSAFVGAVVSVLQSLNNNSIQPEVMRFLLQNSADDLNDCSSYGAGIINATKLFEFANNYSMGNYSASLRCKPTYKIPTKLPELTYKVTFPLFGISSLILLVVFRKYNKY